MSFTSHSTSRFNASLPLSLIRFNSAPNDLESRLICFGREGEKILQPPRYPQQANKQTKNSLFHVHSDQIKKNKKNCNNVLISVQITVCGPF